MSPIRIANKARVTYPIACEQVASPTSRTRYTGAAAMRATIRWGLLSTTAIVSVSVALVFETRAAPATWNGTTSDYTTGSNWTTASAPVHGGQVAIFSSGGVTTVNVGSAIAPNAWVFDTNAQSYAITGATVNFVPGITNGAASAISIANTIGGTGFITQTGTGTLTLTGANTYTGGTTISAGTLQIGNGGTGGSITGNITNNAALAFNRSDNVTFGGVISGSGAVNQVGTGITTLTGVNIYTGGTIVSNGSLVLNTSASITSNVVNAAAFNNSGTVTGTLTSSAGSVNNFGLITDAVNVSGGRLTGSGSTGSLTFTGGTFAPGNGTAGSSASVTGNLVLASAVEYVVQVTPATASFTSVTGTAALGGAAVTANFASGSYVARQYTILTAAGGRTGTFGALTNTNLPANFTANLSYGANRAFLDLTLGFTTASGLNRNQQNVANTLTGYFNRTGGIPLAFGSLSAAGLSQASGELGAGTQQTTFDAAGQFIGMMTDPSTAGRGDTTPQGAIGYAAESPRAPSDAFAAMSRKAPVLQFEQRWNVWSAGFGGAQTTDGNAATGSGSASSRIYGGAVGADYRMSPNTTAGFALAGGGTSFSVANGSGRSDLFQAGGFVRHSVGATYLSAAFAYGWQDVTTERSTSLDRLSARFSTNTLSGRIEVGHRLIAPVLGIGLTPYAAVQVTSVSLPNYGETAGAASTFGLNYAAKDVTATRSELGLRTDKAFAVSDGVMTLRSRAAWAHNYDPDRSVTATFQSLPGASFVVNGAAQASDAALVTGSAEMAWRNGWTLAGTFEGEFSNVTRSYAGKGVVRYGW